MVIELQNRVYWPLNYQIQPTLTIKLALKVVSLMWTTWHICGHGVHSSPSTLPLYTPPSPHQLLHSSRQHHCTPPSLSQRPRLPTTATRAPPVLQSPLRLQSWQPEPTWQTASPCPSDHPVPPLVLCQFKAHDRRTHAAKPGCAPQPCIFKHCVPTLPSLLLCRHRLAFSHWRCHGWWQRM